VGTFVQLPAHDRPNDQVSKVGQAGRSHNNRRLLGSIGDIPPAEAQASHYALVAEPMAA